MPERSVSVALRANVAGFVAGIRTAQTSVNSFTKDLEKNAARKQALLDLGNAAGVVGLAAAAGVGVAVKAAADFDKAMSGVEAATHAGGRSMEALRQAALKAGADTAFSATEAAGGIEALSKAGVSVQDVLRGGLNGALSLAAAGNMEVSDAAESAATAMTQFGLSGGQVPHVADLLAAAAGKAQGEVSDFSMALNQSGLVANQTGLSIEETTGALAAFASQGLIGSDAGTSLKTALQSLTPSSEKAANLMEDLGISAYDSQGNFIGLANYAGVLRDRLSSMSAEQRNATLKTIFGSDAVRAASVLYDQGADGIQKWINKVNDAGFAAETAAIRQNNLAGDLEKLQGSLSTLLITSGEGGQGPLRQLVQGLTGATDALNKLPQPVKTATLAFGGLVAVTGGATFLGTRFLASVAEAKVAMSTLGISATKAKFAVRGLGVAAAAFGGYELTKFIQDLTGGDVGHPPIDQVAKGLDGLTDATKRTGREALPAFDDLGQAVDRLAGYSEQGVFETFGKRLVGAFSTNSLSGLKADVSALDRALANLVQSRGPEAAEAALRNLARAKGLDAEQTRALLSMLPQYGRALKNSGDVTRQHAGAVDRDTHAVEDETTALEDNIRAHNRRTNTLLEGIDKNIAWEQSVDDAGKEARKGTKTLDVNTQAGRDNLQALSDMAAAWNELPDKTKRAQGGIKDAREEFIRIARQMGADKEQARELARELLDIPNPKRKVEVDTQGARNDVSSFTGWFNDVMTTRLQDEDVKINVESSLLQLAAGRTVQGPIPKKSGGPITGGVPGKDSVLIAGMPGEHMLTKSDVDKMGGQQAVFALRRMVQRGEFAKRGDLQYMRNGGPVVRMPVRQQGLEQVVSTLQANAGALADAYGRMLSEQITQAYQFGGGRPLGPGGSLSAGQIAKGQQFARSQAGKPYQWGGVGNPSWDCSGFVGGVLLSALGRSPYQRIGTTASMPWPGFRPGTGTFTTGTDPGSHMDGNIGGLGIESRGGDGIVLGSGITPIGSFARVDHYDNGGVWRHGRLGVNMSGGDELVITRDQARWFFGTGGGGGRGGSRTQVISGRMQITNWQQGWANVEIIAEDVVAGHERHRARVAAMR